MSAKWGFRHAVGGEATKLRQIIHGELYKSATRANQLYMLLPLYNDGLPLRIQNADYSVDIDMSTGLLLGFDMGNHVLVTLCLSRGCLNHCSNPNPDLCCDVHMNDAATDKPPPTELSLSVKPHVDVAVMGYESMLRSFESGIPSKIYLHKDNAIHDRIALLLAFTGRFATDDPTWHVATHFNASHTKFLCEMLSNRVIRVGGLALTAFSDKHLAVSNYIDDAGEWTTLCTAERCWLTATCIFGQCAGHLHLNWESNVMNILLHLMNVSNWDLVTDLDIDGLREFVSNQPNKRFMISPWLILSMSTGSLRLLKKNHVYLFCLNTADKCFRIYQKCTGHCTKCRGKCLNHVFVLYIPSVNMYGVKCVVGPFGRDINLADHMAFDGDWKMKDVQILAKYESVGDSKTACSMASAYLLLLLFKQYILQERIQLFTSRVVFGPNAFRAFFRLLEDHGINFQKGVTSLHDIEKVNIPDNYNECFSDKAPENNSTIPFVYVADDKSIRELYVGVVIYRNSQWLNDITCATYHYGVDQTKFQADKTRFTRLTKNKEEQRVAWLIDWKSWSAYAMEACILFSKTYVFEHQPFKSMPNNKWIESIGFPISFAYEIQRQVLRFNQSTFSVDCDPSKWEHVLKPKPTHVKYDPKAKIYPSELRHRLLRIPNYQKRQLFIKPG